MNRKRAKTLAQPSCQEHWDENLYSSVTVDADDVFCSGSDDDYYESPVERERRLVAAAQRFLQHGKPHIMTSTLIGPFDANSGWTNPWSSKRHKQTSSRFKSGSARKTSIEAPVSSRQQQAAREKTKATHLPTPESLNGAHIVCSEPLSSNSRIRQWQRTVVAPNSTASPLSASPSISQNQPGKRKAEREPTLLGRRKRSRVFEDASNELDTPSTMHSQPQSARRTREVFHPKDCANRHEAKDSNDELRIISPSPFRSQKSDPPRIPSTPAKRSPVREFFASHSSNSEDELGLVTPGSQKSTTLRTPTVLETSTLRENDADYNAHPQSEAASSPELVKANSSTDDSSITEKVAAEHSTNGSTLFPTTTPKTPTRHLEYTIEDESSSDEDDMSVMSDSGMRALSVELNSHEEPTISPRRSARLRANNEIVLPSIVVNASPEAGVGAQNDHSEITVDSVETEGMMGLDVDTRLEIDTEAAPSQDVEFASAATKNVNQPMTGRREPLAALNTNQRSSPIEGLKPAAHLESNFPDYGIPQVQFSDRGSDHQQGITTTDIIDESTLPDAPLESHLSLEPQTPKAMIHKAMSKSPEAMVPLPQTPTTQWSEAHVPTFAAFMSPSPQRSRVLARQRPRKTVTWAPLPDGREDSTSSEFDGTASQLINSSEMPRRMASPPPDSEALGSALQEDQNLGQLFTTLNNKGENRPRSAIRTESFENEPQATNMELDQATFNAQESSYSLESAAGKVATLSSDEDAWLDMIMDNVEIELATHAWDDAEADQMVVEVE